jgi:hypothetical protein
MLLQEILPLVEPLCTLLAQLAIGFSWYNYCASNGFIVCVLEVERSSVLFSPCGFKHFLLTLSVGG